MVGNLRDRDRRLTTRLACSLYFEGLFAIFVLPVCCGQPQLDSEPAWLSLASNHADQQLSAGEQDTYWANLATGDILQLTVSQSGVDVALDGIDPRARQILVSDSPSGLYGPELLIFVAHETGRHSIVVRGLVGDGIYHLRVEKLKPAKSSDRSLAEALRLYLASSPIAPDANLDVRQSRYRRAASLSELNDHPWLAARSHVALARLLHRAGELKESLSSYDRSTELYEDLGRPREMVAALAEAGELMRQLGKVERARWSFLRAVRVAEATRYERGEAFALNNLGVLYASLGEVQKALETYDRALAIWRRLGDGRREATVLHNLGVFFMSLGRPDEALVFLKQALASREVAGDLDRSAVTLTALGGAFEARGDLSAARESYEEALELRRHTGDLQGTAVTLDLLGGLFLRRGDTGKAIGAYRKAFGLIADTEHRLNRAHTAVNLARAYVCAGQADEEALELLEFSREYFVEIGDLFGQASVFEVLARLQKLRGHFWKAVAYLEEAVANVESIRGRLHSQKLRSDYMAGRLDVFNNFIDLLMQEAIAHSNALSAERAFEISERSRARSLLESLSKSPSRTRTVAPPELLARERHLRAEIDARLEHPVFSVARNRQEPSTLDAQTRGFLLEYDKLQGRLRSAGKQVPELVEPLSLEQIRTQVLDDETLLLAYSLGDERSYLWLVGMDSLIWRELPPRDELEALARTVHQHLPNGHRPGYRVSLKLAVDELSRKILSPVVDHLDTRRLVILPDGALHYVPFSALPLRPRPQSLSELLLEQCEVVYLPSASVLAALRSVSSDRPPAPKLLAILADPTYSPDDPRITREFGIANAPASYPRLIHSAVEARALAAIAGEESLHVEGSAANKDWVLRGRLSDYRLIHFATHGLADARHPALSGLVLSLLDERGRPRDGFLRVHDLYDLNLLAELVVLSACRTAIGYEMRGEGLAGLAQGFFHAGSERLVVSLWNVSDRGSAELMSRFYRSMLETGLAPSAALREAQLSMMRDEVWRAPYYWAGFILQGDWRVADLKIAR